MKRAATSALNTAGWTSGHCAALAAQLEVTVPKPGNVGRGADFADTSIYDFLLGAQVLGQEIDRGERLGTGIGRVILDAVSATRGMTHNNPNLGIVLLLVPLARAAAALEEITVSRVQETLNNITPQDSADVFEAIRLASPGGLGRSETQDVADTAEPNLIEAMNLASDRDLIAREFATGFAGIIGTVGPLLADCIEKTGALDRGIVLAHVSLIAEWGDSLIERKCGMMIAAQAMAMAGVAVDSYSSGWDSFEREVGELDFWMRSEGNRRNPGTTADLIAAGIFVQLWSGKLHY